MSKKTPIEVEGLRIYTLDIDELTPDPENGNKGTQRGNTLLETSITSHGIGRGIHIDKNNVIVAGNKTFEKAGETGTAKKVIVIENNGDVLIASKRTDQDLLNDPDTRAAAWADNRVSEVNYDPDIKRLLEEADRGVPVDKYFLPDEMERYRALIAAAEAQEQEQKEQQGSGGGAPNVERRVQPGEVWQVGRQTIVCGDCRTPEAWAHLHGRKISIVFTSPPYADQREYDKESGFKPIPPDQYCDWFEPLQQQVKVNLAGDGSFFVNIKENIEDGQRLLYVKDLTIAMVREWEWLFKEEFAAVHGGTPGRIWFNFKNAWEPVFQFCLNKEIKIRPDAVAKPSASVPQGGGGNVSAAQGSQDPFAGVEMGEGMAYPGNVWKFYRNAENWGHDAAFAPEFPEQWIKAYTDRDDLGCDPFLGSGSTAVALQRNDRDGFHIELSPLNCDRCIARLEQTFSLKANRITPS